MSSLYTWLKFLHLLGVAAFLFAHGVSGGTAFALRGPVSPDSPKLLWLSQRSNFISNPALLLILATGIWMGFVGHWWGQGWMWAAIVVLVAVLVAMGLIARPYYLARDAVRKNDSDLAERLSHTQPVTAMWIGGVGLLVLIFLMVVKPF